MDLHTLGFDSTFEESFEKFRREARRLEIRKNVAEERSTRRAWDKKMRAFHKGRKELKKRGLM